MAKKDDKDKAPEAPAEPTAAEKEAESLAAAKAARDLPDETGQFPRMVFKGDDPQATENQCVVKNRADQDAALANGWRLESLPMSK